MLVLFKLQAQPPAFKILNYIETYSAEAINQMVVYKIPASVILAQAIFESRNGESLLARKSNNHFGIKCHVEWGGDTVVKHDDTLNECFRKYVNIEDSYTDHSMFLSSRSRYASLFELPITDYKSWCTGLKLSGYATYSSYAEDLINIIEKTKLYELDGYENITPINVLKTSVPELLPVENEDAGFSIVDYHRSGLLFEDERDLLIHSLDMLMDQPIEDYHETAD